MAAGTTKGTGYPDTILGYPKLGYPYSIKELKKAELRGPLFSFLRRLAVRDVVQTFDDFNRLNIGTDSDVYALANGSGSGVASFAINTQYNGVIRATTGTGNGATASASLIGPVIYPGYASPGMEVRFKAITAITSLKVEVGFIDAVPGSNTGGTNNLDTPTAYMANGALAARDDSTTTSKKWNFVTIGSATNQAIKATVVATDIPAATTYQTIRIQLISQELNVANSVQALMWLDGALVAQHDVSATAGVGAVNGSVLLAPWVYVEAVNATSKSLDVDYLWTWAERI